MKTLNEAWELIESMNGEAYRLAYDSWLAADAAEDDEDDWSKAEEMREDASQEQAEYFRDEYGELSEEDRNTVDYWIKNDEDFREQFLAYYGDYFE